MQGLANARPSARFRACAALAAGGIVAGAVIALDRALHVRVPGERAPIGFVAIAIRPASPVVRRNAAAPSGRSPSAPTEIVAPNTVVDPQLMRALRCTVRSDGVKRAPDPDCPPLAPFAKPEDWARPNSIPKPPLTREELFSFGERMTTHRPLSVCGSAAAPQAPKENGFRVVICGPSTPPPPPPAKSPAEYCRAANMGGPCEPPPQERVVPE